LDAGDSTIFPVPFYATDTGGTLQKISGGGKLGFDVQPISWVIPIARIGDGLGKFG
jgi:hypothetical protein